MWRQSECCSSGLNLAIFHFFARKFYIFELIFLLLQKFVRKRLKSQTKIQQNNEKGKRIVL